MDNALETKGAQFLSLLKIIWMLKNETKAMNEGRGCACSLLLFFFYRKYDIEALLELL